MDTSAASFPEHFDFRTHDAFVRRLAHGLLRDGHDADDAAQDVWLAAIEHAPRETGALRNWLAHVTKNFAIRSLTSRAARTRREEIVASEHSSPDVHEMVAREEIRQKVFSAAVALEEPYRTVILLRYFSNLPPRVIAQRLGVPVETVRTRQKRGIELVRARLVGGHGDTTELACTVAAIAGLTTKQTLTIQAGALAFMTTKTKFAAAAMILLTLSVVIWMLSHPAREFIDPANQSLQKGSALASVPAPKTTDREAASSRTAVHTVPADSQAVTKPAAASDTGTLLVHVLWSDDKKPAVGVQAQVIPRFGSNPMLAVPRVTTDATGTFRVDNLLPGAFSVEFDRASGTSFSIVAGKTTEETFTLREGYNIDGIVINSAGAPIVGADIILSESDWDVVIGVSNQEGRFMIRGVDPLNPFLLCARAGGYSPSIQEGATSKAGSNISFKLVLPASGGGIAGRALDTNGKPVSKARVVCYPYKMGGDGREWLHGLKVPRLFTDSAPDGTYRLEGLQPGINRVMARIVGYSVFKTTIEIPKTGIVNLDLSLEPGVTVAGTVTDVEGKPATDVKISIGRRDGFDYYETTTPTDGNYVLRDLSAGEIKISAVHDQLGKSFISLTATSGSEVSWNPSLSLGFAISGRVVDETGNPLTKCIVMASPSEPTQGESYTEHKRTDASGRFNIQKLENIKHLISAVGPGNMDRVSVSDVRPGGAELEIVLKANKHDCYIIGKVVGADGMPMNNVELSVRNIKGDGWNSRPADFKTGEFKVGPYPAGRYRLVLKAKDYPELILPFRELKSSETWDAGLIKLQKGGKLRVEYSGVKGLTPNFSILDSDDDVTRTQIENLNESQGRAARSTEALAPGNYQLVVTGWNVSLTSIPFTIPANDDAVLPIVIKRGIKKSFVFKVSKSPADPTRQVPLSLVFKTKSGLRVAKVVVWTEPGAVEYSVHYYSFPPGDYQFEASAETGKASGVFTVTESESAAVEVMLQ